MSLFQNENMTDDSINYKSLGKDQLIMLIQSQKSDIDVLSRKLYKADSAVEENTRLEKQVETLSAENESLKAEIAQLEEKLSHKEPEVTEAGSIAEMSFRVNGVLEAAQKAADDYLAKIKEMHDAMKVEYKVYELKAKEKADSILKNANIEAAAITQNARNEANDIWSTLQTQFNSYIADKKQDIDE